MILKEVEDVNSADKYQKAGLAAEKQMAFYLKRAFADNDKVLVINSLRLEKSGDAAQIDHLIIHEYGMFIIESKSVSTKVAVNEYGEWVRIVDGGSKGMPSPVKQAQRQADFLKSYLTPHTEKLLKKFAGIQFKYNNMPIDIIVAISDQGIISRPKKKIEELDYIRKADQVVDKISEVLKKYKKEEGLLSLSLGPYIIGETGRANTSQFLLKEHKSSYGGPATKVEKTPQTALKYCPKCGKCHGSNVEVAYGKYGYYIKCRECEKNTAIKEDCPTCEDKLRIRKQKMDFFLECNKCQTSELFHKNV